MSKVEARVASIREKKQTWVPKVNRVEENSKPNLTESEYYSNGKRMSPTALLCAIRKKVDGQMAENNGSKPREEEIGGGVTTNLNFSRFTAGYLQSPREYKEQLPDGEKNGAYT